MAYLVPEDFRGASLHVVLWGRNLETTDVPDDSDLQSAIAWYSKKLDDWCNDHFEPVSSDTVTQDGSDSSTLILTKRWSSIDTVTTVALDGTTTSESSDAWRHIPSLNSTGDTIIRAYEKLEVVNSGLAGTLNPWNWGCLAGSVQILGTSGWTTTPDDIKRALGMLVWNHFKPQSLVLAQVERQRTTTTDTTYATTTPSGFPEVDEIIGRFTYEGGLRAA